MEPHLRTVDQKNRLDIYITICAGFEKKYRFKTKDLSARANDVSTEDLEAWVVARDEAARIVN